MLRDQQLRLVYSLLKPALRTAAHFGVPIRTLVELLRLAYYETLVQRGQSPTEIAKVFGQTSRHIRSLAARFGSDFFAAEKEIGVVRAVEDAVARGASKPAAVRRALREWSAAEIADAIDQLLAQGRIERGEDGLRIGTRYAVLASEHFHHRIDALNHFLDAAQRAAVQRLVHDDKQTAMMKTISFIAVPAELRAFLDRLEGDLRRELGTLEETASFEGAHDRFALGLMLAKLEKIDE